MVRCPRVPAHADEPGNCRGCGTALPRNRDGSISKVRRWCSDACAQRFLANHEWTAARAAAIERDGHRCVTCGAGPGPRPERPDVPRSQHEWSDEHRFDHDVWRVLQRLYHERLTAFRHSHMQLEVNHIEPRRGGGYGQGCHHHQVNLETLCHPCHVQVTARQRRARPAD